MKKTLALRIPGRRGAQSAPKGARCVPLRVHMKAGGADAQSVKFTTTSINNLGSASDEHMNAVQFTFRDNDHFTATWNNIAAGKSMAVPFEFTRVR
jgi:hypothetical protein